MRPFRSLLVALALVGCNGVSIAPRVDAASDAGPMGDGSTAPDAWELQESPDVGTDAATLEDAGTDAALEVPDAFAGSDAGELTQAEACERVQDAYAATGCNPDFYWCGFSAPAPSANVVACEDAIAFGYSEASGPADTESRCSRAIAAMGRCG